MRIVDNIIALRILWMLITPFDKTDAYKLGLISDQGDFLKKAKTTQEVNSSSMLHRLVWRIKKFINMVPGGSTKIGSMVAAYALVRECIDNDNYLPELATLNESTYVLSEDDTEMVNFFAELSEEIANVTGANVSTDTPNIKPKRAKSTFKVSDETFSKFKSGKAKFRRWGAYLNLDDDTDREIYHYAKKNPRGILVLQDNKGNSKGIRYSKHGGGNWHGISRKPKKVVESYLNDLDYDMECTELC